MWSTHCTFSSVVPVVKISFKFLRVCIEIHRVATFRNPKLKRVSINKYSLVWLHNRNMCDESIQLLLSISLYFPWFSSKQMKHKRSKTMSVWKGKNIDFFHCLTFDQKLRFRVNQLWMFFWSQAEAELSAYLLFEKVI